MASIHLQGILRDSLGEIDVGAIITFTHETATGETLPTTKVDLRIPPNGAYSIDVEYGRVRVDYTTRYTERFIGTVIVNQDSTATSLPELLNAAVPVTPAVILEMQGILADAVAASDTSEAFANQLTTFDLIGSAATFAPDTNITTKGYLTSGDGGSSSWVQNGVTGQPTSQSPSQLNSTFLNDALGNQWSLVVGQTVNYDGTQLFPLPFGAMGAGMYNFDDNGWGKVGASDSNGKVVFYNEIIDGVNLRYDRNHIINYIDNRPEAVGSATINGLGRVPYVVSGDGAINYTLQGGNYAYTQDAALYLKGSVNATGDCRVRLSSNTTPLTSALEIAFNFNHVTSQVEQGTISYSIFGVTGVIYTGVSEFDMAVVIDTKPTGKAFYFLERQTSPLNKWVEVSPRISGLSPAPQGKASIITNNGGEIELDHCELDGANYIAIGDSLCAGANLFDPSPSANRADFSHQWEQNCILGGVNNFIFNRGIGGNSSEQINSRIQADVIDKGARVCFLHLSTNDERLGVSYQDRQSITQSSINSLSAAGVDVILLNSVYPNNDQAAADYYRDWINGSSFAFRGLTGYRAFVDQMLVLKDSTGNLDPAYTNSDGIHLNQAGYDLFGSYIQNSIGQNLGEQRAELTESSRFNFKGGLLSGGANVNTSPSAKYTITPISGSQYYSVQNNRGDDILLSSWREVGNPWVLHIITKTEKAPGAIYSNGSASPLTSALAHQRGVSQIAALPDGNTFEATYSSVTLIDGGAPSVGRPDETLMSTLSWIIIF